MRRFDTLAREMDAIVENGYVIIGSPDEVAEQLKDVFAEWEDRWWPRPMEREGRAALPSFRPAAAIAAE